MVAVAAPAALLAALGALLFLLAWKLFGNFLVSALNVDLPVIGNVIGKFVADDLETTYQVLAGWLDAIVTPIAGFILSPVVAIENVFGALLLAAENGYNVCYSIITVRIPQALDQAVNYANIVGTTLTLQVQTSLASAVHYADTIGATVTATATADLGTAIGYADSIGAQVTALAGADLGTAIHYTDVIGANLTALAAADLGTAIHYADTIGTTTEAYATGLFNRAETDISAVLTTTEAYANGAIDTALAGLAAAETTAIGQALGGVYTDIDTAISDLTGVIGDADADILAAVRAIPLSVPRDIAGVAALAGTTALTLTRFLKDCGIPQCKSLSGLVNDLDGLASLIGDAAFLALLVELVTHPSSAAEVVESAFGDVISAGEATARALFGIAA